MNNRREGKMSDSFDTEVDSNGNITRTYSITVTGCYNQHLTFERNLKMMITKIRKERPMRIPKLLPFKMKGSISNISDVSRTSSYA
jgi:acyl-CoA thioesterase FadM